MAEEGLFYYIFRITFKEFIKRIDWIEVGITLSIIILPFVFYGIIKGAIIMIILLVLFHQL